MHSTLPSYPYFHILVLEIYFSKKFLSLLKVFTMKSYFLHFSSLYIYKKSILLHLFKSLVMSYYIMKDAIENNISVQAQDNVRDRCGFGGIFVL